MASRSFFQPGPCKSTEHAVRSSPIKQTVLLAFTIVVGLCFASHQISAQAHQDTVMVPPASLALNAGKLVHVRTLGDTRFKHSSKITHIEPLPDGKHVITTSRDSLACMWHLPTGKRVFQFPHEVGADVWNAKVISQTNQLLTCGDDNMVKRWDLATGKLLAEYNLGTSILRLALLDGGTRFVAAMNDNKVQLWDIKTGKEVRTFKGHTDSIYTVAVTNNNKTLISGSDDKTIRIWEIETGKMLHRLKQHTSDVYTVAASPDGKHFASCSNDNSVKYWNIADGKLLWSAKLGEDVAVVSFSPDGKSIAASCEDTNVYILDINDGKKRKMLSCPGSDPWAVAYSIDGKQIYSGGDHAMHIWDVASGKLIIPEPDTHRLRSSVASIAIGDKGKTIVAAGSDTNLHVFNTQTAQREEPIAIDKAAIALSMSQDRQRLLIAMKKNDIRIRDMNTGLYTSLQLSSLGKNNDITRAHFANKHNNIVAFKSNLLVATTSNNSIGLWNATTGQHVSTIAGHARTINDLAISGDGQRFATFSSDQAVKIWSMEQKEELTALKHKAMEWEAGALSNDAILLISVDKKGMLCAWGPTVIPNKKPPSADAIKKMITQLGSDEFKTREDAMENLIRTGEHALPHLKVADTKDLEVRWRVKRIKQGVARLTLPTRMFGEPIDLGGKAGDVAFLPDNKHFAVSVGTAGQASIMLGQITENGPRIIARASDGFSPNQIQISSDGKTVYTGNRTGSIGVYSIR